MSPSPWASRRWPSPHLQRPRAMGTQHSAAAEPGSPRPGCCPLAPAPRQPLPALRSERTGTIKPHHESARAVQVPLSAGRCEPTHELGVLERTGGLHRWFLTGLPIAECLPRNRASGKTKASAEGRESLAAVRNRSWAAQAPRQLLIKSQQCGKPAGRRDDARELQHSPELFRTSAAPRTDVSLLVNPEQLLNHAARRHGAPRSPRLPADPQQPLHAQEGLALPTLLPQVSQLGSFITAQGLRIQIHGNICHLLLAEMA